MHKNGVPLIAPTDELIEELRATLETMAGRKYRRMMKEIDWYQADRMHLHKAVSTAVSFTDMKQAEYLTDIGLERFPEDNAFQRTKLLFEPPKKMPPPVRRFPRGTPGAIHASAAWIREHNDDYELGHWLAVKNGVLIAEGATREEFDTAVKALGDPEILTTRTLPSSIVSRSSSQPAPPAVVS
ncbi:MAG: hypothetical protein AAF639_44105 [Chloroflexota bacterium]